MTTATHPTLRLRAGTTGAVEAEVVSLAGREVVRVAIGPSAKLGALSHADGRKLAAAAEAARCDRLPFVCEMASTGALVGDGLAASFGWGLAARELAAASGLVPILFLVHGPAISGTALLLGLADQVVMTEEAYAFVTGPQIVRQVTGVRVGTAALGGAAAHQRHSGVAALVAADLAEGRELLGDLLAHLPSHVDELPPEVACADPPQRPVPECGERLPDSPNASYDVRDVIADLVDDAELLELRAGWAPNLVTGLARLAGRPVGVLANQPMCLAGTLDIAASQKGAAFVSFCDAFNLPLVTLVDTPGFYPGKDLEWRGMIRHGAQLAFAYARATVPRVSVTLRKSYGGAYIVMDSRTMGNDVAFAWPTAEIAVMGARGAAEILHRRADAEERAAREADYEERFLNPYVAAERGLVDTVIEPAATRAALAEALEVLAAKREHLAGRHHDNTPL